MKNNSNNLITKSNPFIEEKSFQSKKFEYQDLNNKDGFYIVISLPGTLSATTGNYNHFFIARHPLEIMWVSYVHSAVATVGTPTLNVQRLTSGVAAGSGDNILVIGFDTTAPANVPQTKQGKDLTKNTILIEGDRLALVPTGTLTNLSNVVVTVYCYNANRGSYY